MRLNRFIFLFFLSVVFYQQSVAQRDKIDSLKKILPLLKDTVRVDCLNALCKEYIFLEMNLRHYCQPCRDTLLYYNNQAYKEAKKINYIHGIAQSFIPKAALQNHYLHNFKEFEKLARESLKWFELTANKEQIEIAYWQIGAALYSQYSYDSAAPYMNKSYYWAEKNGNKEWQLQVLGFMYEFYRDIGEYDKAFGAFQKTQQLNLVLNGKIDSVYEFHVLAELQRRLGNYSTAVNYYRQVIAAMDLPHENIWYRISYPELFALNGQLDSAGYYYNLIDSSKLYEHEMRFYLVSVGEFYLIQTEYKKALGLLLRGLIGHRKANDIAQANRALLDIAKAYTALQQDGKALAYTREGLATALQSHSKQYIRDAYQILYEIYQRRNEIDSAFVYYQKYVTEKEVVASDMVKGQFAAYNYQQKISLLDKEKIVQQQQLKQTAQQKTYLITGIAGLVLLGIFLLRNIMLKRKNETARRAMVENELLLQKVENERTKAELEQQATELEMQALRAQMNPHFIFNSLNSINRFILQNNRAQASEYLVKFSRLVRLILQNSQSPAIPLKSEIESLQLYLELEAVRFDHHFNFIIRVDDELDIELIKVPPLIIQPYAENAIWHGLMHKEEKGQLDIEVFQENNMLCCKITDDGIGRKKAAALKSKSASPHKSMGMRITADRIAMLQSRTNTAVQITDLILDDGMPGGTEILLQIPLFYDESNFNR